MTTKRTQVQNSWRPNVTASCYLNRLAEIKRSVLFYSCFEPLLEQNWYAFRHNLLLSNLRCHTSELQAAEFQWVGQTVVQARAQAQHKTRPTHRYISVLAQMQVIVSHSLLLTLQHPSSCQVRSQVFPGASCYITLYQELPADRQEAEGPYPIRSMAAAQVCSLKVLTRSLLQDFCAMQVCLVIITSSTSQGQENYLDPFLTRSPPFSQIYHAASWYWGSRN